MEDTYGCNLINTKRDGRQVTEFVGIPLLALCKENTGHVTKRVEK